MVVPTAAPRVRSELAGLKLRAGSRGLHEGAANDAIATLASGVFPGHHGVVTACGILPVLAVMREIDRDPAR
jgi:hypothetical protein